MNKKNFIVYFNIAFLIVAIVSDVLYMTLGNPYIFKTFASLVFVFGGLVNLIYVLKQKTEYGEYPKYKWFMMIGLVFACLGDILLIDYFIIGAGLFAIGHIWYTISYCSLKKFAVRDLLPISIVLVISLCMVLFVPILNYESALMKIVVVCYAIIISVMLGKAISNAIPFGFNRFMLVLIGSLMFFLSDTMLLFNVFGEVGKWADVLCLVLYYPAEFVLATSISVVSKNNRG